MNDWAHELKWNAIAYAAVACAALMALVGMRLLAPALHKRWLPLPRLRPVTWTGHEVFLAFCIFFGFQITIVEVLFQMGFFPPLIGPAPDADAPRLDQALYLLRCRWIGSPMTLTVTLGILFAMLFARTGTRPHHYGLSWSRWPANVGLGIVAFVVGRPLIFGIFALSLLVFTHTPDPFEALVKIELPPWEWSLIAFQTTVAAPLLEEIVCRGILQGWLRRASLAGHIMLLSMTLVLTVYAHGDELVRYDGETEQYTYEIAATAFSVALVAGYGYALNRLARGFGLREAEVQQWLPLPSSPPVGLAIATTEDDRRELNRQTRERDEQRSRQWADANAWLAIFGSAMLFAIIHPWPHALAMLPMGLLLGWLYQRTQSLVAPITFHMLFNLTTFIALYGSVLSPP